MAGPRERLRVTEPTGPPSGAGLAIGIRVSQQTKRCRLISRSLAVLICVFSWSGMRAGPGKIRVEKLPYHDGDILRVVNNIGAVEVRAWKEKMVEARWIEDAAPDDEAERPKVDFLRYEGRIFLIATARTTTPTRLELKVPSQARLIVQGIDPTITVRGVNGLVSARTLRGRIDIVDSKGPVIAFSRSGEIHYQVKKRPVQPAILLTGGADVYCHVPKAIQVQVEIAAVSQFGNARKITHEPADCADNEGKRPCLRLVNRDQGRIYRYEGVEVASKIDRPAKSGGADPPELRAAAPSVPGESPPPDRSGPPSTEAIPSFRVDVDWVRLSLSVAEPRGGRRVTGLVSDDFEVYEDGILQQIHSLQGTDEPFQLLVLLDVSGSTASYLPVLKRAVRGFVRTLRPKDRLALAAFNAHPFLVQGFTDNRGLVEAALRRIPPGGGTGFYEALGFGLDLLSDVNGRKAMVVFTDGMDESLYGRFEQAADITFPEVLEKVKETDALLYTISLDSRQVHYGLMAMSRDEPLVTPLLEEAKAQLESISDHSGTPLYAPTRPGELKSIFAEIADDLKSRYTIAYRSNNPAKDGRWRKLTVKVANHPEFAVRTRRGYYAGGSSNSVDDRPQR